MRQQSATACVSEFRYRQNLSFVVRMCSQCVHVLKHTVLSPIFLEESTQLFIALHNKIIGNEQYYQNAKSDKPTVVILLLFQTHCHKRLDH